jgi:NADH dehydrogenase/NADH:ubiquinone oxidoreductase subunit G
MDCTVNVGLGGGSKERDMAVLQIVYGLQKELLLTIGADNPYVKPKQLYNTLEKLTETAGFPSAEPFFSEPDEAEVQAKIEEAKNAPDPEMQKVQAQIQGQMQLEQMKAQTSMQLEQGKLQVQAQAEKMKAEVARDKEMAQMQADMQVKQQEANMAAMLEEQKMNFEREKFMAELSLREREMTQAREIKLLELQAQVGMAEHSAATKSAEDGDRKAGEGKSLDALKSALEAMNKPRRVIRDDNGEIVGVEPLN